MLKVTAQAILDELQRRGVETQVLNDFPNLMRYFYQGQWHLLHSSLSDKSSAVGELVSEQKLLTTKVAQSLGLPVPETVAFTTAKLAEQFMVRYQTIVVKPVDAAHGNGVTVNVRSKRQLAQAIEVAQAASESGDVLLQQQVAGDDLRVLTIDGKFVSAMRRTPAQITGDGKHTIAELIAIENKHPDRGPGYTSKLNFIDIDAAARFLGERLEGEKPATGKVVQVVGTANMGTGGQATDCTGDISPQIIADAEQLSQALGLGTCGVDFMHDTASGAYYFIEANATPSFHLHEHPSHGAPRPVTKAFVDYLLR